MKSAHAILACLMAAAPALATVDDAQSFALEAAQSWVKQGMEIRYDYARGTAISGRKTRISYQVFKGNRYWFFAGGSEDGIRMEIAVQDPVGLPVPGKTNTGNNSATFHFTAPRTMLVSIDVTGHTAPGQAFNWAVVYGFQSSKHTTPNPRTTAPAAKP
jgi:hypothetical protein